MYQSIGLFEVAGRMAAHGGARQAHVAKNIANADTPGYRAMALPSFAEAYGMRADTALRATRPGHQGGGSVATATAAPSEGQPAPNGNDVSLESELLNSIEAGREHRRALAIYKHAMTVVRTALGPGR